MTHQEFNYIFYKYSSNKKGIKLKDKLILTGYELKDFLDFAIEQHASIREYEKSRI